jgi:uncharacterized protein
LELTKIAKDTVKAILNEFRLNNCSIVIREDISDEQLIDVIEGNKKYVPGIVILNKIDMIEKEELKRIKSAVKPDICVSAEKNINIEELKELIFKKMNYMRIYCKEIGKKADMGVPLIMQKDSTLKDMCEKLHKDFVAKFKFARIWGTSVKFPGMKIMKLDRVVQDEDIVEIHLI